MKILAENVVEITNPNDCSDCPAWATDYMNEIMTQSSFDISGVNIGLLILGYLLVMGLLMILGLELLV